MEISGDRIPRQSPDDLVISKTKIVTSLEYLAPLGKSDYTVIIVNTNLQEDQGAFVPRQNYNKGQYEELRQFLQLDWDSLFRHIEIMWK